MRIGRWCVVAENEQFQLTERMPAHRHPLRDRVLNRIRRGELASVREIMLVASIPRQTANRWLREAGIKLEAARLHLVAKMREQEERYLQGLPALRKPTKRQARKSLERAIKRFNAANGRDSQIPDEASGAVPTMPASGRGIGIPG